LGIKPDPFLLRSTQRPIISPWLEKLTRDLGTALLRQQHLDEIERAVNNVKRSAFQKWFRREWYRTAWKKRQRSKRYLNNRLGLSGAPR